MFHFYHTSPMTEPASTWAALSAAMNKLTYSATVVSLAGWWAKVDPMALIALLLAIGTFLAAQWWAWQDSRRKTRAADLDAKAAELDVARKEIELQRLQLEMASAKLPGANT
jgi:hypothetical protein